MFTPFDRCFVLLNCCEKGVYLTRIVTSNIIEMCTVVIRNCLKVYLLFCVP